MELERSVFRVHDRALGQFADELLFPPPEERGRCTGRRICGGLIGGFAAATVLTLIGLISLHRTYVFQPGCVAGVLGAAVESWRAAGALPPNATAGSVFASTDVFRIGVDWLRTGCPNADGQDTSVGAYTGCVLLATGPPSANSSNWPAGSLSFVSGKPSGAAFNPTFIPDYLFSSSSPLVSLALLAEADKTALTPSQALSSFRRVTVVVPPTCSKDAGAVLYLMDVALFLMSYDTVIVNDLQWGGLSDERGGYLRSLATGEDWGWGVPRDELVGTSYAGMGAPPYSFSSFLLRIELAFRAVFAGFFLLSGLNAMLIRVLLTSGVSCIFALAYLTSTCMRRADRLPIFLQAVADAYPWLGVHVAGLIQAGAPVGPLLWANTLYALVCFLLYECATASLTPLLFGWKSYPAGLPPLLWTLFGVVEAGSYAFLRSKAGLAAFPRAVAVLYALFCVYYVTVPYGFFTEAAFVLGLALLTLLLAVIWFAEVPALAAGAVTLDRPRAAMMEMATREPMGPGLAPGLGVPPLWTVLHPLQSVWPEAEPVPEAGPPRLRSPPQPAPPAVSDDTALTLGGGQGRNGGHVPLLEQE
jgi:hypothetical protein